MGFNRRKMEDQRREAADKEAATRRATDAQVLTQSTCGCWIVTTTRPCRASSPSAWWSGHG